MTISCSYSCECCGHTYQLAQETTVFLYHFEPEYNHLVTVCPNSLCGAARTLWDLSEEEVNRLVRIATPSEVSVRVVRRALASRLDQIRHTEHRSIVRNRQLSDRIDFLNDAVSTLLRKELS